MTVFLGGMKLAFNYVKAEKYDLDFDNLANHLSQNQIINFDYYKEWIEGWLRVIKNADKDTDIQVENLRKNGLPAFEVFTLPVYLGEFNFILNFIVEGANAHIEKKNPPVEKFAINRFDSEISWTKENKDTSHDINKPIIITALPLEGYEKKVVIDGNHRVTMLYANNVSTINGFFIEPADIIQDNILILSIDKAIYSFIIETEVFRHHLRIGKHSHADILKSSNINNAFKKFNR